MYLECINCKTNFLIDINDIRPNGRQVKCSKCAKVWYQECPKVEIEDLISNAIKDRGVIKEQLPALIKNKSSLVSYILPFIMVILIVIMIVAIYPKIIGGDLGYSKDMGIENFDVSRSDDSMTVSYKVVNYGAKAYPIPLIRIRLLDKNRKTLKSYIDNRSTTILNAGDTLLIKSKFSPISPNTTNVDLMMGSKIDFLLK